jgi:hypothetical protein
MPAPKGGGWYSPVDIGLLHRLVTSGAEATNPPVVDNVNPCAIGLMGLTRPVGHIQRPHAAA